MAPITFLLALRRNWKAILIGSLILLLIGTGFKLYFAGRAAAEREAELARVQVELQEARDAAERERAARIQDAILAEEAAKRIMILMDQISDLTEYVNDLEDADLVCLDGDDTDELRKLWE